MEDKIDKLLTVSEVAERLKFEETTIRKWIKQKTLKAHEVGGQWRIWESDMNAIIGKKE